VPSSSVIESRLKQRLSEVVERTDRSQLDERTTLALETAQKYARGELAEPRFSPPPPPE
jgi:hypothetical protein